MAIGNIKGYLFAVGLILIGAVMIPATDAATYYVSGGAGNDDYTAAQAQNINTPWQTIQRAASNMAAGDTCLIRSGTYRETVTVSSSGTSNAPMVFQAYNDEQVLIVGTESVTNWTQESAEIYSAPMDWTLGDGNQVFMNWTMLPLAQWPNAGASYPWPDSSTNPSPDWSYATTAGNDDNDYCWLTDSQLPSRPDGYWNGCTMHIMSGYGWIMLCPTVTSYDNANKRLTTDFVMTGVCYKLTAGNEYYLTGNIGEMDSPGEWFYDSVNGLLYIYLLAPPSGVEVKKRSYGFNLAGRSYVKLVNLDFFACTIQTDANSTYCEFDGLYMRYLNHSRKNSYSYGLNLRNGNVLRNSELAYDSQGLVNLLGNNIRVINNHLHDSGYIPAWTAMIDSGIYGGCCSNNLVSHNTMHDSGRALHGFPGEASIVEYNNMHDAMKLTSDGGVFNCHKDGGNTIVRYNLMHDSCGAQGQIGYPVEGIYLDAYHNNWVIHNNIIWNVSGHAILLNNRQNFNMIFNNTCWGSGLESIASGFGEYIDGKSGSRVVNNLFEGLPFGYWGATEFRHNLYYDPLFVNPSQSNFQLQANSSAINRGMLIAGVTDGYVGNAPDQGALEYGGTNWTGSCGYQNPPPSPDPVYNHPDLMFCNKIKDGGFERGSLAPNWTVVAGSSASLFHGNGWVDSRIRTDYYALMFGQGNSEVRQTVTGLLAKHAYELYGGLRVTNGASVVKLGVRNYGYAGTSVTASVQSGWAMYCLPFMTGQTNTSAEIYVSVTTSNGVNSEVYADDLGVEAKLLDDAMAFWLKLDETNGTATADASGYGHNGVLVTGSWTTGEIGGAVSFNGAINYLSVNNVAVDTTSGGSNTVCFWMKWNGANGQIPFAWNGGYYCLFFNWNAFGFNTGQGNLLGIPGTGLANRWVHVAAVFPNAAPNTNNVKIYIDGAARPITVIVGATPAMRAANPSILFSGWSAATNASYKFNGAIDDARIYNRELAAAEVAILAAGSPALWLKLDETNGTVAADSSGLGHNGEIMNGPAWSSGEIDGALSFDGTNDYVMANSVEVNMTSGGRNTVCFWMKWAGGNNQIPFVWNGGWYDLFFHWNSFGFNTGQSNLIGIPSTGLSNRWVHVAAVFPNAVPSTNNVKLYIDGVSQALTVNVGTTTATRGANPNVLFGSFSAVTNSSSNYKGLMDDMRVYNRELTAAEVAALAAN